jgi:preprotein translocase subunit Sec61beta
MAKDNQINLPGGFGGLVSYKEEYKSKFMLNPTHVVGFIIFLIALRVGLTFLF